MFRDISFAPALTKKTIFSGANQMCSSNLTAKGDYFWMDHFQTHPVFLHSSISSDRISLSLQNIFILVFFICIRIIFLFIWQINWIHIFISNMDFSEKSEIIQG